MGGRTEGRTDGRTEGGRKTDGRAGANGRRADGRADGRADIVFFYCFASGRTDGQANGRTGGRRVPPAGRTGGRADFERQYNDFHRFSQKASKNTVFFCRFASGGSASTDFYSSNEKGVQKTLKNQSVF